MRYSIPSMGRSNVRGVGVLMSALGSIELEQNMLSFNFLWFYYKKTTTRITTIALEEIMIKAIVTTITAANP